MGASPRQLAYRDRFVWELEQVVSSIFDDCDGLTNRFVFPDMSTRVPLVLYLSQTEFTTLYSAVLTGADLSYPNTSHDVENLFLQMVTCDMNALCEAIADCILNNLAVQQALDAHAAESGYGSGAGDGTAPLGGGLLQEDLLPDDFTCDNDHVFGTCVALADSINEATTEVLQALEILTNPIELAAELGDNVPGAGVLASAGDIAVWMQDTAVEAYVLAWSTSVRDEIACLLFCEMKDDCTLDYDRIFQVYLDASGAVPPIGETLEEWLAWLILLALPTPLTTVATISLLGLLAMRYGGRFGQFTLGIRSLEMILALAADDTNSDWDTLCTACAEVATPIITASCAGSVAAGTLLSLGGNRWRATLGTRPVPDWAATISRDGGECFTMSNVVDNRPGLRFHGWLPCIGICAVGFTHPAYGSDWLEFAWTSDEAGSIDFDFDPA